jgi:hypothetical protein
VRVTQATVKSLVKQIAGQANTLTIPRVFVSLVGDHLSALLLSQVIYWTERSSAPGWFYKSLAQWEEELGLSAFQVRRATLVLKPFGLITMVRKVKGTPTLHYHLDEDIFLTRLVDHLESRDSDPLRTSKMKKLDNRETTKSDSAETAKSKSEESQHSLKDTETITDNTAQNKTLVYEVFDYWRKVMEKPKSNLTRERRKAIEGRLRDGYTVEQIKGAIDGCSRSAFHMGENDQGRRYDDLELICRSGSKLEGFLQYGAEWERRGGQKPNAVSNERIVGGAAPKLGKYDHLGR